MLRVVDAGSYIVDSTPTRHKFNPAALVGWAAQVTGLVLDPRRLGVAVPRTVLLRADEVIP
jgi:hypothetical protein